MRGNKRYLIAIAALAGAIMLAAVLGGAAFIQGERDRALLHWQTQLGIIADGRASVVDGWLGEQLDTLRRLSDNAAVQIYVMGLARGRDAASDLAQQDYLRNLLDLTAQADGFLDRIASATIPANVRRASNGGLIVLSADRRILVQSEGAPTIAGGLGGFVAVLTAAERARVSIYAGEGNQPVIAFAVPIFAVQGGSAPEAHVGFIVGAKEAANELYPLLAQPGDPSASGESLMIARDDGVLRYISPRRDGARPLTRQLSMATPALAGAYAWNNPGAFAEMTDYANRRVLVTGRRLANGPWALMYKVDRAEAVGALDRRARTQAAIIAVAVLLVVTVVALAWSLGASRKSRNLAEAHRLAAAELEKSRDFLALLRDEDPDPTFTVSRDGTIGYANAAFARLAGAPAPDLVGKTLDQALGPGSARRYEPAVREALAGRSRVDRSYTVPVAGRDRIFESKHVFLPRCAGREDGVLVIEHDVTEAAREREHRRRIQDRVVGVVVSMIDQIDPTARGHSTRVARLAEWIAETLRLDAAEIDAVRQAAIVSNIGKALVPADILSKTGALSEAEHEAVRAALARACDLLSEMDFYPPALAIVRASRENWDGSGDPAGLAGEAIPIGARIVRVANAFVALTSARAYRAARSVEEAFETLLAESGAKYDRRTVVALMHFLDNAAGREQWRALVATPS